MRIFHTKIFDEMKRCKRAMYRDKTDEFKFGQIAIYGKIIAVKEISTAGEISWEVSLEQRTLISGTSIPRSNYQPCGSFL